MSTSNVQFCVKCERRATKDLQSVPKCDLHYADPFLEENPKYKGTIPEGSDCAHNECLDVPVKIFGGVCFCQAHYKEAKDGHRYRGQLGI